MSTFWWAQEWQKLFCPFVMFVVHQPVGLLPIPLIHHGSFDLFPVTFYVLLKATLSSCDFQSVSPQSVA
jgi:hypothetical protein